MKRNAYTNHYCHTYFWRTFDQTETDYIEEYDGSLHTYEFKWKTNRTRVPASLLSAYTVSSSEFIDGDNLEQFIQ